ncbi:MAG: hypothetical protein FD174_2761 [Geobacteraceae bacterium]|nr:MAG: hypothetical protein FD174_2761 [Geobacteraceae bacterium]
MDKDKERQEISLIGRLFSMEALLIVMGLFSLVSGIVNAATIQIFWGVVIIGGSVILYFVRKKDWKKHWEEQEQMRQEFLEKRKRDEEKGK